MRWPSATANTIHCIDAPHFCLTPILTMHQVTIELARSCRKPLVQGSVKQQKTVTRARL